MSSFSPPPFSSSPPQMGGFSPPPMDNFSPPPMSSFSPPPINGFSPPPLDDNDDVIGDHFGLRRHSDMSDDNSFDLTGFSEKMKKIEIEKIKHLPPREILEIQRESLGEQGHIFVSLNGLDVENDQKHKRLFINNQSENCQSANKKLNIDFDETVLENSSEEVINEPVNDHEDSNEVINENKNVTDESEDASGDPLEFGDFSEHQTLSEPLKFDAFSEQNTSDVGDMFETQIDGDGVLSEPAIWDQTTEPESLNESEFISKCDDFVEHIESNSSDDHNVLDNNTITRKEMPERTNKDPNDGHIMAKNYEDLESIEDLHEDNSKTLDAFNSQRTSFEDDPEKPVAFDAKDNENVSEKDDDFDAFGDFGEESSGFETNWRDFEPGESSDWVQATNESAPQLETKSTGIEFDSDDDDDDDFGDFGDVDDNFGELSQSIPGPASTSAHNSNATYQSQIEFEDLVRKLLPKVSTVIINMYETVIVEPNLDDENDMVEDDEGGDNLVESVLGDPVIWERVEDPSSAPALDYTWLQSDTYTTLLNTLNIDTRNVLDGEGWKNSVPKFAANLMTPGLLQPLSAEHGPPENAKQNAKNKELVQPAEFDWNNSGLVDPLDTDGQRSKAPAPSSDPVAAISQLTSQKSQPTSTKTTQLPSSNSTGSISSISAGLTGSVSSISTGSASAPAQDSIKQKEKLSREAAALLDSFPLLSFMSSSVLTFPVKSVERKGKRKT